MEQRLSFVTLGVADLDRSKAFYEALGWTASPVGEGMGIVFFQLNGIILGLFPRQELADDAGVANTPASGFSGVTLSHNSRKPEEAEAILAQAVAAGATVTKPMHKAFWGGHVAYFADPDGHNWEVCFNPGAVIAADGTVSFGKAEGRG